MGAERTMTGWLAGILIGDIGYQPRHRSTRRDLAGADLPVSEWDDHSCGWDEWPDYRDAPTDPSWLVGPAGQPDILDQLTSDELRRLLEDCALDDVTKNIPDLVRAIGHSSHTTATLTSAWREFRQCTRDAYALRLRTRGGWAESFGDDQGHYPGADAVALKLRQADDAWWLITNGLP
jgi:hypothetical protein